MSTEFYVRNAASMMRCYNLPTVSTSGKRLSLILGRKEVSRPLTQDEFDSMEVQKGLQKRELLDVTRKMNA